MLNGDVCTLTRIETMAAVTIAFDPPENGGGGTFPAGRPIDFAHLQRQTMGDKDLEAEILSLFAREARQLVDRLAHEPASARPGIAHRLKGAARGVGAFRVAAAAEALEALPDESATMSALLRSVTEAADFICGLSR